jgi:hypothetical protein
MVKEAESFTDYFLLGQPPVTNTRGSGNPLEIDPTISQVFKT